MNCRNKLNEEIANKLRLLYKEHRNAMYADAKNILKEHALAEDAVQQAFLKIIDKFEKLPNDDFEITRRFLRIVAKNVAIDMYNSRKRKGNKLEYIDEIQSEENQYYTMKTPCDEIIEKENKAHIYDIIEKLPEKYKDVLILDKVYGYSQKEIAEILNISYDAVKKRAERAKKMLKEELGKEELV